MNKQHFGKELQKQLLQKYDIVKISRWAYQLYSNNCRSLDSEMREILEYLFSMEDDPQFEYTEEELRLLAQKLIDNEDNPLNQINEMKRKAI
ncbi:MAG: hypothetical protein M3P33_01970 [bacterium]|nr:hypothetical protein [bacterium]